MRAKGKIAINWKRCKGCRLCVEVCPKHLIQTAGVLNQQGYKPAQFMSTEQNDEECCTACGVCAIVCPEVCIEVYRAQ